MGLVKLAMIMFLSYILFGHHHAEQRIQTLSFSFVLKCNLKIKRD